VLRTLLLAATATATATAIAAAPVLAEPPPPASSSLAARLAGASYTFKKVILTDGGDSQQLRFSDDASGAPCDDHIGDHYLLVTSVTTTQTEPIFSVPRPLTLATSNVVVVHYKPDIAARPKEVRLSVTLESIDAVTHTARGRIDWAADDDSAVSGPFEATYCVSKAKAISGAPSAHGLAWSMAPVAVRAIPHGNVEGMVAGNPFRAAFVNVIGYESVPHEDHSFQGELNFFAEKPGNSCTDTGRAVTDGITLFFKKPTFGVGAVSLNGRPLVKWREPGSSQITLDDGHQGNLTLVFDSVNRPKHSVKGRIYLAIDDKGKSLLVGQLDAVYCAEPMP
jgi:hypothetical protein